MHVCVLGAGIVGLAAAWRLRREGHRVTVVDRTGPAAGASGANGGQLSYAYVQPLADPAIWLQLPRLLAASDSPLKLQLRWDPSQWRWGLSFLAACNAPASRRTTAALLALAAESRAGFEAWLSAHRPDCDFAATGKLVIHRTEKSFAAARRQLALQQAMGARQWAVDAAEAVAIEPALAAAREPIAGAIYTPGECAADCHKACMALATQLQELGAALLFGVDTLVWRVSGGQAHALVTTAGELEADAFVVCLGSGSPRLAQPLGVRLPVYPLKGYSLTLPASDAPGAAPRVSVTDAARKVVFARIGSRLRVAGMAELVGDDLGIPAGRIDALRRATHALFPLASASQDGEAWAGLRPATPTGLPVLGPQAGGPRNVLFNTGHGALGFTLAFGSASRLAAMLDPRARELTAAIGAPGSCSA